MKKLGRKMKAVALVLSVALIGAQFTLNSAEASMIRTEQMLAKATTQDSPGDREKIRQFMAREDVRAQMKTMGVNPDEAEMRVASLSDAEAAKLAGRIDSLPAGQGLGETILIVALVVFIVLLITDLVGATRVFPWTRPVR
ncbi:MAG: PA2779 family protein [Candidatus Tectomicrobia bacterium]|uniref:PA2779 family protein n=1 Tax=Tectimicrobiota bacterium TaxID=2528274 RepID=A0A932MME4_UNCTE|nr:PA2779 family protein [Candidatus Tectomicrobia bacterium]